MLNFFQEVAGFLETIWEFIISFIESLLMALGFIISSAPFNVVVAGMMPTIIGTSVTIVVGIAIAKFLLGR